MSQKNYKQNGRTTVYFDGLCRLCSREIAYYKTMRGAENIEFVDITSKLFDSDKEGLDPYAIHQSLHVRDKNGKLHIAVDAFIAIWSELPALRWLSRLAKNQAVHGVLSAGYSVFAKVRPLLPRKSCEDSPYCELN